MTYVKQIGGRHYEYGVATNQHWDLMDRWDIEYLPGCASAYIVRYDRKGTPVDDLDKAISYIDKQLACHPNKGCRRVMPLAAITDWYKDNPLDNRKIQLLELIHVDGSTAALQQAIFRMKAMRNAIARSEAASAQS